MPQIEPQLSELEQRGKVIFGRACPGRILQTGNLDHFNEFDIPSLYGVSRTAPYFRDNSAASLEQVVRHYQLLAEALRTVIPPETPFPLRPDPILDADFEPLIAYLETL